MRYRINQSNIAINYQSTNTIEVRGLLLNLDDIRLIVDETQKIVLCSSMQKDLVGTIEHSQSGDPKTRITFPTSLITLVNTDTITFEVDLGDKPSGEGGYDPAKVAFETMKQEQPYLTAIEYSELDYESARAHLIAKFGEGVGGGCTCVWKDGKLGRNYDYNLNYAMDYLVRIKAHNGKAASIGCASVPELTKDNCNIYSDEYKYLPFRALDGMNEHGLAVAILLLNTTVHSPNGNTPLVEEREIISAAMLDRYIIDSFKTATEAVSYIRDYVRVKPIQHNGTQKDVHFMVADKTDCYALEFIGTEVFATHLGGDGELPAIMANFLIKNLTLTSGVVGFDDLEDYAQGVERYQIAQTFLQGTGDLMTLMTEELKYTNLYANAITKWLTDCSGDGVTYKDAEELTARWMEWHTYFLSKTKEELREDGRMWQTVHSVVYDLDTLTMQLVVQEGNTDDALTIDCFKSLPATKEDLGDIDFGTLATLQNQQKMMVNFGMSEGEPQLQALTDTEIINTYDGYEDEGQHIEGIADATYGHLVPAQVTIDDEPFTFYQERTYADYGYSTLYRDGEEIDTTTTHPQEGDELTTTE